MVEIRGKRGRKVPLLLTKEMKEAMQLLLEKREDVQIDQRNPYLFATPSPGSLNHLRSWDCLHKFATAESLNLKCPEAITGTRLRKYIATVSQVLDLEDRELDWLARHMGHDIRTHREYYRLQDSTIELAKVSKILSVVDKGQSVLKWVGMPLDKIDVHLSDGKCTKSFLVSPFQFGCHLKEKKNKASRTSFIHIRITKQINSSLAYKALLSCPNWTLY